MTGFGSPCGACKFLRRKCVRGCVFAPYFSHEQGATHFGAIHRVFGASNASKLLMQLPVSDRPEAAASISYEAQARIQDPVYGCVAHIFALQQQVISLQAQVSSLKAHAIQRQMNNSSVSLATTQNDKFQNHDNERIAPPCFPSPFLDNDNFVNFQTTYEQTSPDSNNSGIFEEHSSTNSIDMETSAWGTAYNDYEDLQSVAYAYMHGSLDL